MWYFYAVALHIVLQPEILMGNVREIFIYFEIYSHCIQQPPVCDFKPEQETQYICASDQQCFLTCLPFSISVGPEEQSFCLSENREYPYILGWILSATRFLQLQWLHYPESESEVAQSCPTLCDPTDCNLSGSSVHGIFQAIVLEWIAVSFSSKSSRPRDWTQVSHIVDRRLTVWATRVDL